MGEGEIRHSFGRRLILVSLFPRSQVRRVSSYPPPVFAAYTYVVLPGALVCRWVLVVFVSSSDSALVFSDEAARAIWR